MSIVRVLFIFFFSISFQSLIAQPNIKSWTKDGFSYYEVKNGDIVKTDPRKNAPIVFIKAASLVPKGETVALDPASLQFSTDEKQVLIFTNTEKVWRYNTRGDYWVYILATNELRRLGQEIGRAHV